MSQITYKKKVIVLRVNYNGGYALPIIISLIKIFKSSNVILKFVFYDDYGP